MLPITIRDIRVDVRSPRPEDLPLIFSGWVESFRTAHAAGPIPSDMYRKLYREIVTRVLMRSRALVAFNADRPSQLLGFVVHEAGPASPILHYVFVKQWCRRWGVATLLLQQSGIDAAEPFVYTFKSQAMQEMKAHWPGGRWDPMVVRRSTALITEDAS